MPTLHLIRHAHTALAGAFCGQSDPPLSPTGQLQAKTLLTTLANIPFDAIYTSDLQRALQTGAPLAAARQLPLHPLPGLRELHFGQWESLTWPQIEARDPHAAAAWLAAFPHLPAPSGEPFAAFQTRVLTALDQLRQLPGKHIAVLTHAGPIRLALSHYLGLPDTETWPLTQPYCCHIPVPTATQATLKA